MQLVEIYQRKRDFASAHAALAKVQAINNGPDVKLAEAELLDAEGKTAQAIPVLESVISQTKKAQYSDPEKGQRIQILSTLADWQRMTGKTLDSVASLHQIADLDPRAGPTVEAKIVDAYIAAKDFKTARQSADAALKKFPGDRVVSLEHATLLGELGQTDAAIGEFKAMPNSDKDRDILVLMASVQEKGKRYADEQKTLDTAESLSNTDPEKQDVIFRRGAMFEREKSYDDAERDFAKCSRRTRTMREALNYLGYMFADRGVRLDEAQQMISKALDIVPGQRRFPRQPRLGSLPPEPSRSGRRRTPPGAGPDWQRRSDGSRPSRRSLLQTGQAEGSDPAVGSFGCRYESGCTERAGPRRAGEDFEEAGKRQSPRSRTEVILSLVTEVL